jgi:transposase
MDLRQKIVNAVEEGGSIRKVAQRFDVGKNLVQKLVTQLQKKGHIQPAKQGGSAVSPVWQYKDQLGITVPKKENCTLRDFRVFETTIYR